MVRLFANYLNKPKVSGVASEIVRAKTPQRTRMLLGCFALIRSASNLRFSAGIGWNAYQLGQIAGSRGCQY